MRSPDQSELRDQYQKISERFYNSGHSLSDSIVRLDSLVEATKKLELGQSLLVLGHMGVGKTSFLKCLRSKFGEERSLLIENLPFNEDKEQLKREIGIYQVACFIAKTEIANSRSWIRLKSEKKLTDEWYNNIEQSGEAALAYLDNYVVKNGVSTPILIALDYERGLKAYPETFEAVTELSKLPNLVFALSLHARPMLSGFIDQHTEEFERFYVPMLERDEIDYMMKTQLKGTGIEFDSSAIDAICNITGGRPYEVQLIAHGLLSPSLYRFAPRVVYTEADVIDLYQNDKFQKSELYPVKTCLEEAYKDFTSEQKKLVAAIVLGGKIAADTTIKIITDELIRTGIFRLSDDGSNLDIRGEFARRCFETITTDSYSNQH
jgi:hypothetical protein